MPGLAERLFWPIAKRWIAGREIDDAIRVARDANKRKISAIINRLGEHTPDPKLIQIYTDEYLKLLDRMEEDGVQGCISVKPSQLGLAIDPHLFEKNLSLILEKADQTRRFVWIDMESSPYTEATLSAYRGLGGSYKELGVCLQANLKRTQEDLKSLIESEGKVRLTKGAYSESGEVAYKKKSDVNENYVQLMTSLFKQGSGFAVATHDEKMVLKAEELNKENKASFEFEMLQGIRDDLKLRLAGEGYRVGDYIPYGPEWFNYSKRRLRERKRTIVLLIRSITG
jgi:proline dehydrogenase